MTNTVSASIEPAVSSDPALPVDRSLVDALVRTHAGTPGVLAIRAVPQWTGDHEYRLDGVLITVAPCSTPLAVRDVVSRRAHTDGRLVLLTDLTPDALGDGIRDHLVGRRPLRPDAWQALRQVFAAGEQEAGLLQNSDVARAVLRHIAGHPPAPAPGGVLTRHHLMSELLRRRLGLDVVTTAVDLLSWAARPDADVRYLDWSGRTPPGLRADVERWLTDTLGSSAAGVVAGLRRRRPSDLVPLGLIADVACAADRDRPVGTALGPPVARDDVVALRVRLEEAVGGEALDPVALAGWAQAAVLTVDRLAGERGGPTMVGDVRRRADALAEQFRVGGLVELSDHLSAALDLRLDRFAELAAHADAIVSEATAPGPAIEGSPAAVAVDAVEGAWNRIAEHSAVSERPESERPRDVALALAILRLLRFEQSPDRAAASTGPRHLAAVVSEYRRVGSWVDTAVNDAFIGCDRPRLADVAHRVLQRVRDWRADQDGAAARLLAASGTSGFRGAVVDPSKPMGVEDILDRVVAPLVNQRPADFVLNLDTGQTHSEPGLDRSTVLVVIADGMSAAAANDIVDDINRRHRSVWQPLTPVVFNGEDDQGTEVGAVVAALPTVTRVSRCSLLSGEITSGEQDVERRNFSRWLTSHSLGSRRQTLFHKADLTAVSTGHALPQAVREAIDDTAGRPVVACVLNAIDDALDRSDPIGTPWTTTNVTPLDALLHAASRVGRLVVLTSDHGHVVERREQDRQAADSKPARWRPAPGSEGAVTRSASGGGASADEILVQGERVATADHRAILAVAEQLRYSARKAGYHGGGALAEIVVPLVVLVPGEVPEHLTGRVVAPAGPPDWWTGVATTTPPATPPATAAQSSDPVRTRPASPPGRRRPPPDVQPDLFSDPGPAVDLAPGDAPAGDPDGVRPALAAAATVPSSARSPRSAPDPLNAVFTSRQFADNLSRFAPSVPRRQVERLVRAIITGGGRLSREQAAAVLGMTPRRLPGLLSVIGQVLNVDGVIAFAQRPTEVVLTETLLYEQFGVDVDGAAR